MAQAFSAILLLPLLFEDQDFLRPVVLDDGGLNLGIRNQRTPDLDVAIVFDEQNITQLNFSADFTGYLFQPNRLSGRHPILLTARFDHGVHSDILLRKDKPQLYTGISHKKAQKTHNPKSSMWFVCLFVAIS